MARRLSLVKFFLCCVSLRILADEAPSTPPSPPTVQLTVERAIGYLQTETAAWASTRKCAACHHAAMGLWALSEADRRGYAVDKTYVADMVEAALGSMDKMMAAMQTQAAADAMAHDGVVPETLVITVES